MPIPSKCLSPAAAAQREHQERSSMPAAAAVVVDPYSSGRYLVAELAEQGVPMICVRSSLKLGEFFLKVYDELRHHFLCTLDFVEEEEGPELQVQKLAAALSRHHVGSVIAGSEPGVELADALSAALGLPTTNDPALTSARKDKYQMHERLRECGIPCADQVQSADLEELLAWARARGSYPVVLKPNLSCGSDGVYFCRSESDITRAHGEVFGEVNKAGRTNDTLVIQEFLAGDEYVVDTVSNGPGRHLVAAVWVYKRMRGVAWDPNAIVLDETVLLPSDSEHAQLLAEYTLRCLDAFGVAYGPAHSEVMLTSRGPVLVEVNCRMHGLQGPLMVELATGVGIHNLAADVYTNEGRLFERLFAEGYRYQLRKHGSMTSLISPGLQGTLAEPLEDSLGREGLVSCFRVLPAVQVGGMLRPTRDLHSLAGTVMMLHEDPSQLRQDILRVRELERQGKIYKLQDQEAKAGMKGASAADTAECLTDAGKESDSSAGFPWWLEEAETSDVEA